MAQERGQREETRRDDLENEQRQQGIQGRMGTPVNLAAIAMRGIGQYYDMQVAAARMMLQSQARAACSLGLPDYSDLFRVADGRAKRIFSETTEHLLRTTEQANSTLGEVQRELGRLMESQTVHAAENLQRGLEELEAQTEESLSQLREFARQQAEEVIQATESLSEAARETMREGSEQMRETVRQGFEGGREMVREQSESMRKEGERVAGAARSGAEEAGDHTEKGRRSRAA